MAPSKHCRCMQVNSKYGSPQYQSWTSPLKVQGNLNTYRNSVCSRICPHALGYDPLAECSLFNLRAVVLSRLAPLLPMENRQIFLNRVNLTVVNKRNLQLVYQMIPQHAMLTICQQINNIWSDKLKNKRDPIILDLLAGTGSSTLAFCEHFMHVIAAEQDKETFWNMAANVTDIMLLAKFINKSPTDVLTTKIKHDILFLNPIWEYCKDGKLSINGHSISGIFDMSAATICVAKVPLNYDLGEFRQYMITHRAYDSFCKMKIVYLIKKQNETL